MVVSVVGLVGSGGGVEVFRGRGRYRMDRLDPHLPGNLWKKKGGGGGGEGGGKKKGGEKMRG